MFARVHRIIRRNKQPNNYYFLKIKNVQNWKFAFFSKSNFSKAEGDGDKRFTDSFSVHTNLYETAIERYRTKTKFNFVGKCNESIYDLNKMTITWELFIPCLQKLNIVQLYIYP